MSLQVAWLRLPAASMTITSLFRLLVVVKSGLTHCMAVSLLFLMAFVSVVLSLMFHTQDRDFAGPFCVKAYDQSTPLLSCGPALDEIGDSIPCGEGAPCKAGQVCPVAPCPPICHTTCNTGCLSM